MAVYQLTNRMSYDPESGDTWVIERAVPNGPPMRLLFEGTRREAMSEVKRLNAFLKSKTETRTPVNALPDARWSTPGPRLSGHAD